MKHEVIERGGLFRAHRTDRNGTTNWYPTEEQAVDALRTPKRYNPKNTGRVSMWRRMLKHGFRSAFTNALLTDKERREIRTTARTTRTANRKRHKAHRWGKHY